MFDREAIEEANRKQEVRDLRQKMNKFAPLFYDMMPKNCHWPPYDIVLLDATDSFCRMEGWQGSFIEDEFAIIINSDIGEHCETVLLHEMLHLHEYCLDNCYGSLFPDDYRERLKKKIIKDFHKRRIDIEYLQNEVYSCLHFEQYLTDHPELFTALKADCDDYELDVHDDLFFLKSLDLDVKTGFKLGTVYGYGVDEYIEFL